MSSSNHCIQISLEEGKVSGIIPIFWRIFHSDAYKQK